MNCKEFKRYTTRYFADPQKNPDITFYVGASTENDEKLIKNVKNRSVFYTFTANCGEDK